VFAPGGNAAECAQDVCVINNVAINSTQSQVGNGVNFTQVCNQCKTNSCKCIISGSSVSDLSKQISLGTLFNSFCGPTSECYQLPTGGGAPINIPCEAAVTDIPVTPIKTTIPWQAWVIIAVIAIIIILVILAILYGRNSQKYVLPPQYAGY
jgi:hypothetical protein